MPRGAPAVSVFCSWDAARRAVSSGAPSLGKDLPPADRGPSYARAFSTEACWAEVLGGEAASQLSLC